MANMDYNKVDILPNHMISLNSTDGSILKDNALVINHQMIEKFSNQVNRTFCGPASLALLMNALNLGYHIKFQSVERKSEEEYKLIENINQGLVSVTEDDVVSSPAAVNCLKSINLANGLTLMQLQLLTSCSGLGVNTYFAYTEDLNLTLPKRKELIERVEKNGDEYFFHSVEEFKNFAIDHIGRPVTGLIANYHMGILGYKNLWGHFSPLAAYHKESDRFLVMDVWPETPPAWVLAEDLFKAMATVDDISGFPRGFLHVHELL